MQLQRAQDLTKNTNLCIYKIGKQIRLENNNNNMEFLAFSKYNFKSLTISEFQQIIIKCLEKWQNKSENEACPDCLEELDWCECNLCEGCGCAEDWCECI